MVNRTCIKCHATKSIDDYYRIRTYWHTSCKKCMNSVKKRKQHPSLSLTELDEQTDSFRFNDLLKYGLIKYINKYS